MNNERVFNMLFSDVYPLYIQKAQRKGRTKDEVDKVILWRLFHLQMNIRKKLSG